MKVKLALIIVACDLQTGVKYILTLDNKLPENPIREKDNIGEILTNLIDKYVDLDPNWVIISCSNAEKNGDNLTLYYSGMIPYTTSLKNNAKFTNTLTNQYVCDAIRRF